MSIAFDKRTDCRIANSATTSLKQVASIILAGGEGTRLRPLTNHACKPAIPFGGNFRLIDIPLAHALHSGCHSIFVITQFLASSLHRYILDTYDFSQQSQSSIHFLTSEEGKTWYQGTADSVRQNLNEILKASVDYFLILASDQLYRMDFTKMLECAKKTDADVVVATLPVKAKDASRLGILKIDSRGKIIDFHEKPQDKSLVDKLKMPQEMINDTSKQFLGSMGTYLFKRKALIDLITQDPREDFGKHLIPHQVKKGGAFAYIYDGYWDDIGTIESFYHANLSLTHEHPPFDLDDNTLFNSTHFPPTKVSNHQCRETIICEGCFVDAKEVSHSILGPNTVIHQGTIIRDSYIMGNERAYSLSQPPYIGENCFIQRAIVDQNAHIGNNVRLINQNKLSHYDSDNLCIRDGIFVIPRGAVIQNGFSF